MSEKKKQKSIRADEANVEKFSQLAWNNHTTPPQLLNAVMEAMAKYVEREGELPTPFKIVSKREFEEFTAYKQLGPPVRGHSFYDAANQSEQNPQDESRTA